MRSQLSGARGGHVWGASSPHCPLLEPGAVQASPGERVPTDNGLSSLSLWAGGRAPQGLFGAAHTRRMVLTLSKG